MTNRTKGLPANDGQDDALKAAESYIHRLRIEKFRVLASEQNNPLYVWEAIYYCNAYGYSLPDWCLAYISSASIEIHKLIMAASTWGYTKKQAEVFEPSMTPKEAAALVPQAMEILQKTRNSFERMASDRQLFSDSELHNAAVLMKDMENPPFTVDDVEQAIKTSRNIDGLRAVRNRVKKGKSLLKKAGHSNMAG